jgi:hypothetical protein
MNGFRGSGPPRSFLDTRQCQRVSIEISDLAGGVGDRLRAYPGGEARGIPARIAFDSGDYEDKRRCRQCAGYARPRGPLVVGPTNSTARSDGTYAHDPNPTVRIK